MKSVEMTFTSFIVLILVTVGVANGRSNREEICRQADIVFILDESTSILAANFTRQVHFVKHMIQNMQVGPEAKRVSVITFSTDAKLHFDLAKYSTRDDVIKALGRIKQRTGHTNTSDALKLARTRVLAPGKARKNIPKVAIVITDGNSQEPSWTKTEALRAKKAGIVVFAVGVGKYVEISELRNIARSKSYVFMVNDFQKLDQIQQELGYKSCAVSPTGTDRPMTTVPTYVNDDSNITCKTKPTDVIFALDSSNSIHVGDFSKMVDFVKSVVNEFRIAPTKTRIGVVTFSTWARSAISLQQYQHKSDVQTALKNITKIRGNTNTARALRFIDSRGFGEEGNQRKDAEKIVVIFTDGKSADRSETALEARKLRKNGVTVMAVGIGPKVDKIELDSIASWPLGENVFTVSRFSDLPQLKARLSQITCRDDEPDHAAAHRKCDTPHADVVFMLDASSSIWPKDFTKQLDFLKKLVKKFKIGSGGTRVAVLTFGTYARVQFNLDSYIADENGAVAAISRIEQSGGDTNIGDALRIARRYSFREANGARDGKMPKIGIVITDGKSQNRAYTRKQARFTKQVGIKLFAVGIGDEVSKEELNNIASTRQFVFRVNDTDKLPALIDELQLETCGAAERTFP